MDWLHGLILGIVQGLAEFLPISSSGHLTIGQELFGIGGEENLTFDIMVHFATVLSTIVVFRKQLGTLVRGFFSRGMNKEKDYIFKIFVSMIPILIVGLFLKDHIEKLFATDFIKEHTGNPLLVVGVMLIITALLLFFSERAAARESVSGGDGKKEEKQSGESTPVNYWQAFVIGIAQSIAVLPGLSRSGSTIATGLLVKVKKSEVAQFSFLMVIIPILGEAFLTLMKSLAEASNSVAIDGQRTSVLPLVAGFLAAFVSGLLACKLMVNLVKKVKLNGFAYYCALAGVLCIVLPYLLK